MVSVRPSRALELEIEIQIKTFVFETHTFVLVMKIQIEIGIRIGDTYLHEPDPDDLRDRDEAAVDTVLASTDPPASETETFLAAFKGKSRSSGSSPYYLKSSN